MNDDVDIDIIEKTFSHQVVLEAENGSKEIQKLVELRKKTIIWTRRWHHIHKQNKNTWSDFSDWFIFTGSQLEIYKNNIGWDQNDDNSFISNLSKKFYDVYDAYHNSKKIWRQNRAWFMMPLQPLPGVQKRSNRKPTLFTIIKSPVLDFLKKLTSFCTDLIEYLETELVIPKLIDPVESITDQLDFI